MEERPIIVFDVETTGTDNRRDQVIELCVQFGVDPGSPSETWRIKPSVEISPGAQEVHGISMEDLAVALLDEAESPKHHRERFTVAY